MATQLIEKQKDSDKFLLSNLEKHMKETGMKQTELARRLSVSPAQINQYLKGVYNGDIVKLEENIRNYLKLQESIKMYNGVKLNYIDTSVSLRIKNIAQMCQYNGEIGVCIGASGLGKTTTIQNIAKGRFDVITVDPNENATPRSVLKQIAKHLKAAYHDNMILEDAINNIVDKLINRGYLIIIDEAENLRSDVFRTLRKVHDRCNFTCSLLFVGTESLHAQLKRMRGEFEYITNRIARVELLDTISTEDVKKLVNQVFPDCDDMCMNAFIALTNKNARILFNTLKRTQDIIRSSGEMINPQMITAARSMLLA